MRKVVAVVDDEQDIVELVSVHLEKAGFVPKGFNDAKSFFRFLKKQTPDLLILDLMLPDMDGIEICKNLKGDPKFFAVPVIMLTAKGEETDKILGLELGADDYVTKPFSPKELVARVKAVLRRHVKKEAAKKLTIGGSLVIDFDKYEVSLAGRKLDLTPTEFKILEMLASKKGQVFPREKMLDYLWGTEKIVIDRTIDVHIRNLREKLGKASKYIVNIRGVGYKLEEE